MRGAVFLWGELFSIFHKKSASKAPKTCNFAYFTSQWGGSSPPPPPLATLLASAVFCLCTKKNGAKCEKSGIFNLNSVPTYHTRTITKTVYCTSVPYFLAKIEAYHIVPTYRIILLSLLLVHFYSRARVSTLKKKRIWSGSGV